MSFGAEMKDFMAGFETGSNLIQKGKDREWRQKMEEIRAGGYQSEEEMRKAQEIMDQKGGGSTNIRTPRSPQGGKRVSGDEAKSAGKERWDYLVGLGVPPKLASGMVGNAYAESGFNAGVWGDKNTSYGEFQWRGDRLTALKNYAAKNKMDPADWKTQYNFAWEETKALPSFKSLMNAGSEKEAADLFALNFERPKGAETGDANNIHQIGNRRSYAQDFSYGMPMVSKTAVAEAWPKTAIPAKTVVATTEPEASSDDGGFIPEDDDDEGTAANYAQGGTVYAATGGEMVQPPNVGMRVFSQQVPGSGNGAGPSTFVPRRVGTPSPGAPTAIPTDGTSAGDKYRAMVAAQKAARAAAAAGPGNTAPDPGAFGPQAYAVAMDKWRQTNKERPARDAYVSHGFGGMNHGQFVESTNVPARAAVTAPTYEQWMRQQPGYSDWVKAYQKPAAPAAPAPAAPHLAKGGAVRKTETPDEPKKRRQQDDPKVRKNSLGMVDPRDYNRLAPGGGPINESTTALWRLQGGTPAHTKPAAAGQRPKLKRFAPHKAPQDATRNTTPVAQPAHPRTPTPARAYGLDPGVTPDVGKQTTGYAPETADAPYSMGDSMKVVQDTEGNPAYMQPVVGPSDPNDTYWMKPPPPVQGPTVDQSQQGGWDGYAQGGSVRRTATPDDPTKRRQRDEPAVRRTAIGVAPTDYGRLAPGGGPLREGTASLWRLQQQAEQRLQERQQKYHAPPASRRKPAKTKSTKAGRNIPLPPRRDVPDAPKSQTPISTADTAEPDNPNAVVDPMGSIAMPAIGEAAPTTAIPPPTTTYPPMEGPDLAAARSNNPVNLAPGETPEELQPATDGYGGSRAPVPARSLDRAGITPGVAPPAPPPPGSTSTTSAYQGSDAPLPPEPLPPGGPPPSPTSTVDAYQGSTPPELVRKTQIAQAIPAGPATPAEQPPLLRRADQPPASAAQGDIDPEPWIPQNVPEAAQGTLSQAWQYGRALVNGPPDNRGEATKLLNDTLIRAMKLGAPHSVISAYADNFGISAPGRPKQAIGFAYGGAVPDDDYSPANQRATASGQPIIPDDEGGNLRAAAPEEEEEDRPGMGLVTPDAIKESTHAGLKWINDVLLSPQRTRAVGADPAQGDAQQKFDTNDHALTTPEYNELAEKVDPENKLAQGEKTLKIQQDLYDFYMSRGNYEKAAASSAAVLMYGRRVSQMSGTMAQAALESGDLVGAGKWMAKAYETLPDGKELRIDHTVSPNGTLAYEIVDLDTGEVTQSGEATADQMATMAKSMSSGMEWAQQTQQVAQGAGIGVGGGSGTRRRGTGAGAANSADKSAALEALKTAGDAFRADPSDENRQAYEDAETSAYEKGVQQGSVTAFRKRYGIEGPKLTEGDRKRQDKAKAAEERATTVAGFDSEIEAAGDDKAKASVAKTKKTNFLADEAFNAAKDANKKRVIPTKQVEDAILGYVGEDGQPELPENDAKIIKALAPDFLRANLLDGNGAMRVLSSFINPANPLTPQEDGSIAIGDEGNFVLSSKMLSDLIKIRNDRRNAAK